MASYQEYKRRSLLPLAGLGLVAYYLLVFARLARFADSLDEPLQKDWRKLAAAVEQTNATTLDFLHITNQLNETRQALTAIESAKNQAAARLGLPADLRARLNAPFTLVDYTAERSKQMDQLERQARQNQVTLDPAVFSGFPEYTTDLKEPTLLWPALALTDDLLDSAVRCKLTAIHGLEAALSFTNSPSPDNTGRWAEIPIQLEFTAGADNAVRFLRLLPLRAGETRAAGLPDASPEKAPLFIDRLIIKKQAPDKPDEVRVWVRAVGFVLRE